jgi:TP901 family phage tail tape measure protein
MSLTADTQPLVVALSLRDNLSGPLGRVGRNLSGFDRSIGRIGRGVGRLTTFLTRAGIVAGTVFVGAIGAAAKAGIDYEDAFAGVRKTVQASEAELDALSDQFRQMALDIPIAATELAQLGEIAGALGVKTESIDEFVRVTALLGVTTNLTAEDAADSLGRLGNVLRLRTEEYEQFASALVALGNAGASTEREIIEIAERAGAGARLIGVAKEETLGWASAVASLGIETEAGGSALQNFFIRTQKMVASSGGQLGILADTAGVSVRKFREMFDRDATGALTRFLEGMSKLSAAGQLRVLEDLGLTDIRITRTILGLANNVDLLTDSLETADKGWTENIALSEEARKRFETTASKLGLLRNRLIEAGITISEGFMPALDRAIDTVTRFFDATGRREELLELGESIGKVIDKIRVIAIETDWQKVRDHAQKVADVFTTIGDTIGKIPNDIKAAGIALGILLKTPGVSDILGGTIAGLGGTAARGAAARIPGIGGVFATPVYVVNWPPGGVGTGAPGAPGVPGAPGTVVTPIIGAGAFFTSEMLPPPERIRELYLRGGPSGPGGKPAPSVLEGTDNLLAELREERLATDRLGLTIQRYGEQTVGSVSDVSLTIHRQGEQSKVTTAKVGFEVQRAGERTTGSVERSKEVARTAALENQRRLRQLGETTTSSSAKLGLTTKEVGFRAQRAGEITAGAIDRKKLSTNVNVNVGPTTLYVSGEAVARALATNTYRAF